MTLSIFNGKNINNFYSYLMHKNKKKLKPLLLFCYLSRHCLPYFDYQCVLPLIEVRYKPNFLNFAEFLESFSVDGSAKYHYFRMNRTKVIHKRTLVTDFAAQLKVYIHLKTLRFWTLFRIGRV